MIVEGDSNTEDDSVYQRVLTMPLRLAHSSKLAVHGVVCSPSIFAGLKTTGSDISHAG